MSTNTVRRTDLATALEAFDFDVDLLGDKETARRNDAINFQRREYAAVLAHTTPFPGVDPGTNIKILYFKYSNGQTVQETTDAIDTIKEALEAVDGSPVVTVEEPWRNVWNDLTNRKDEITFNTYWTD